MDNIFFNAHHSPIGAFSSFTLGSTGKNGGFGLELGRPADQSVFIGLQSKNGDYYEALPFYEMADNGTYNYDVEGHSNNEKINSKIHTYELSDIQREYEGSMDTWRAGDLSFRLYSPVRGIPDPEQQGAEALKSVLIPAIFAELTIDNRGGSSTRRAFFGYQHNNPHVGIRHLGGEESLNYVGVGAGREFAIASSGSGISSAIGFTPDSLLKETCKLNWKCLLGDYAMLIMDVPAGKRITYPLVISFYKAGIVTTGKETSYYYTNFFSSLEEVVDYGLKNFNRLKKACEEDNKRFEGTGLSSERLFMLKHSIRSYYGSTELLCLHGKPLWVVNEGEYRMMNTMDLTVDMLFFEMKMNPWTVRNVLDMFSKNFSYYDNVYCPKDKKEYPGGISFTHDMGVINNFSRKGYSSYEMFGEGNFFAHMTHEQLVNWTLCALVYYEQSEDGEWLSKNISMMIECLYSMVNRDHFQPGKRNGVMGFNTKRMLVGEEITTYDSLDASLGRARNNLYLAVKSWAVYVSLNKIFKDAKVSELYKNSKCLAELAELASEQAKLCSTTIQGYVQQEGYIPALLEEGNSYKIIPAIEGLVFPLFTGCDEALSIKGEYAGLILALKRHLEVILKKGICIFEDGGWKLSATSNNSWLSKIYLCQFVASKVLELSPMEMEAADKAHAAWLLHPELSYWCWSDQIVEGKITGSKYYPRGVTSILWLNN